jgi:phage shock protein PspC (stress-responsive transcriptional regulator)
MRGLGLVRGDAWIGGVCGGIAARLGIDPLIVRGIAVVIALLGGPAFLAYAAAWALLPDREGRIHLERLIRGTFDAATVGIIIVAVLAFLPITQGVWWAGSQFWADSSFAGGAGRVAWTIVLLAAIVGFIIWVGRRRAQGRPLFEQSSRPDDEYPNGYPSQPSGTPTADRSWGAGPFIVPGSAAATAAYATVPAPAAPPLSPEPGSQATDGETTDVAEPSNDSGAALGEPTTATTALPTQSTDLDEWKRSQAAWKQEHDAWRNQQAADVRANRAKWQAESRAQSELLQAQAAQATRARRLANPRTSGGFIAVTLGAALILGSVAAAIGSVTPVVNGYEWALAFAIATAVVGLAMVVAGVMKRRSGFLAFVAIVLTLATLATALPPRDSTLAMFYGSTSTASSTTAVFQPVGGYQIRLDSSDAGNGGTPREIDLNQWIGGIQINVQDGISVRIENTQLTDATSMDGTSYPSDRATTASTQQPQVTSLSNGSRLSVLSYGDKAAPDVIIKVTQSIGGLDVRYFEGSGTTTSGQTTSGPADTATATSSTATGARS